MTVKKDFFIANLSGGKDSSCMTLKLLEEGSPVDMILFCDTGLEFFEMYNHLDEFEQYIKNIQILASQELNPKSLSSIIFQNTKYIIEKILL